MTVRRRGSVIVPVIIIVPVVVILPIVVVIVIIVIIVRQGGRRRGRR